MKMKRIIERIGTWVIYTIVAVPLLYIAINTIRIKARIYHLDHANHAQILAACRQAIDHRKDYRNDKDQWGTLHADDILVLAPLPPDIPDTLRKLNPHHLLIRDRHIIVSMNLPFCRIALIAFPPGVEQYGTRKYIDGLWFWNGDFESEAMRQRVYSGARDKTTANQRLEATGETPAPQP